MRLGRLMKSCDRIEPRSPDDASSSSYPLGIARCLRYFGPHSSSAADGHRRTVSPPLKIAVKATGASAPELASAVLHGLTSVAPPVNRVPAIVERASVRGQTDDNRQATSAAAGSAADGAARIRRLCPDRAVENRGAQPIRLGVAA